LPPPLAAYAAAAAAAKAAASSSKSISFSKYLTGLIRILGGRFSVTSVITSS